MRFLFTSVIMRMPAAITLLVLSCLIQCTTCACNITCTTDYISSLNCSCPGRGLTSDYYLEGACWDEDEYTNVSCEMKAPRSWCILELGPEFYIGALVECAVRARGACRERCVEPNDSTTLKLYENIKLLPPLDVSLMVHKDCYNVSWKMADYRYFHGHMVYVVRIRTKSGAEPTYHFVDGDRRYLEIPSSVLQSGQDYEVDVQARVSPHRIATGFWSEWSPSVKWRTEHEEGDEEGDEEGYRLYCFLLLILVPCLLWFFGSRRSFLRKVHVYVPSPEAFFRPLYHTYEGDFGKWVRPTFTWSESHYLGESLAVSVVREKRAESPERLRERGGEDGDYVSSDPFLRADSLDQSSEDGGRGPDTEGFAAHISIDTVTVLEEEDPGGGGGGGGGRFEFPPFGPGGSTGSEAAGLGCRWGVVLSGGRVSGAPEGPPPRLAMDCLEPRPRLDSAEPDGASLDSLGFAEHSDDGYPPVTEDMDTVDSGFPESDCSSPALSDPDREKMDAPALAENFHSNYVRQWVVNAELQAPREDSES